VHRKLKDGAGRCDRFKFDVPCDLLYSCDVCGGTISRIPSDLSSVSLSLSSHCLRASTFLALPFIIRLRRSIERAASRIARAVFDRPVFTDSPGGHTPLRRVPRARFGVHRFAERVRLGDFRAGPLALPT
jgi:hypothetical protein